MITPAILTSSLWEYGHSSGHIASTNLQFKEDGSIGNYDHPNERGWMIENEILCLVGQDGSLTARFESSERIDGRLVLTASYRPNPAIGLRLVQREAPWPQRPGTKVALARQIAELGWEVGDHTYGTPYVLEETQARLKIGKYTSLAGGLLIALGNHKMDIASTYPFASLRPYWPSAPVVFNDHDTKGDVEIGSDVWIGADVFISSGVRIGNGAVIGAKAVVTSNVPAYFVAAGNPSRIVRARFSEDIISRLVRIRWWDWPDRVVDSFLPMMMSNDLSAFLVEAENYVNNNWRPERRDKET